MKISSLCFWAGAVFVAFAVLLRLTPAANNPAELRFLAFLLGLGVISIATGVVVEVIRWVKIHHSKDLYRFEEFDWTEARHSGVRR